MGMLWYCWPVYTILTMLHSTHAGGFNCFSSQNLDAPPKLAQCAKNYVSKGLLWTSRVQMTDFPMQSDAAMQMHMGMRQCKCKCKAVRMLLIGT